LFRGGVIEVGTGGDRVAASAHNQHTTIVQHSRSLRDARRVHRTQGLEFGGGGAEDSGGCDAAGMSWSAPLVMRMSPLPSSVARLSAFAGHFRQRRKHAGRRIVEFSDIRAVAAPTHTASTLPERSRTAACPTRAMVIAPVT
jgi:hypothetical protein